MRGKREAGSTRRSTFCSVVARSVNPCPGAYKMALDTEYDVILSTGDDLSYFTYFCSRKVLALRQKSFLKWSDCEIVPKFLRRKIIADQVSQTSQKFFIKFSYQ